MLKLKYLQFIVHGTKKKEETVEGRKTEDRVSVAVTVSRDQVTIRASNEGPHHEGS